MNTKSYDWVIIGAGVVGLAIARRLLEKYPGCRLLVVEKEASLGVHASGRNSGVLHAGLYYRPGTLKATLCVKGATLLRNYCKEKKLELKEWGKVIIAQDAHEVATLGKLYEYGLANGVRLERLDGPQARKIEPQINPNVEHGLFSPDTAAFSPQQVLNSFADDIRACGGQIQFGCAVKNLNVQNQQLIVSNGGEVSQINFNNLVNAAGSYADRLAHNARAGKDYKILPFRGFYWELDPASGIEIRSNIYPVPDPEIPFLGIHFTKVPDGRVYVGPSAVPALGRENYVGLKNIDSGDLLTILGQLSSMYLRDDGGFRALVHRECSRLLKSEFYKAAHRMVPALQPNHLLRSQKVGIRAQLVHLPSRQLVNDFLVEQQGSITHVLNAVSPAFTCSLSFAEHVVKDL